MSMSSPPSMEFSSIDDALIRQSKNVDLQPIIRDKKPNDRCGVISRHQENVCGESALPPKADIGQHAGHVRLVPLVDIKADRLAR
jgi:hypothetical protein